MRYYAISHNVVIGLPECDTIVDAISETSKFFKSSLYPAITVNEDELKELHKLIGMYIGGK